MATFSYLKQQSVSKLKRKLQWSCSRNPHLWVVGGRHTICDCCIFDYNQIFVLRQLRDQDMWSVQGNPPLVFTLAMEFVTLGGGGGKIWSWLYHLAAAMWSSTGQGKGQGIGPGKGPGYMGQYSYITLSVSHSAPSVHVFHATCTLEVAPHATCALEAALYATCVLEAAPGTRLQCWPRALLPEPEAVVTSAEYPIFCLNYKSSRCFVVQYHCLVGSVSVSWAEDSPLPTLISSTSPDLWQVTELQFTSL